MGRASHTKDRDRYAELRVASQKRARVALQREIAENRRERKAQMDRLSGSVVALELGTTSQVWHWLRPGCLRRMAAREFDALLRAGWVRSIGYDHERRALAIAVATEPPRTVHLWIGRSNDAPSFLREVGGARPEDAVSTAFVAAQLLAAAGDLRSAVCVLAGSEVDMKVSQEPAACGDTARHAYVFSRMHSLQLSACDPGRGTAAEEALGAAGLRLRKLTERLAALEATHEALEGQLTRSLQDYLDEYDMLCQLTGVTAIKVRRGIVHVETMPVTIPYDGCLYELGRFRIEIRPGDRVRFLNLDCRIEGASGPIDHPHCADTSPCWGNAAQFFAIRLAQHDLPAIIQQAVAFLGQYNPKSVFARIDRWPSKAA